jgi:LacI family transcriptional regulator
MKEVADFAHVSVATVSRVINNSGYVSPDLEERVREAMQALNYHPSALARSLRRQETQTIGLLIPQLDLPFFSTLAHAIEHLLFDMEYRILVCSAEEDVEREKAYTQMLIRQRVDGVIMAPTGHSATNLRSLIDSQVPVVLVDRDVPEPRVSKVLVNNLTGGYSGMKHLLEHGHERLGVIGAPAHSTSVRQRLEGAQRALREYGIDDVRVSLSVNESTPFEFGYRVGLDLLGSEERPTAIFALTDVSAIGVMHAAAHYDLTVPHDLSVLGFDNIPLTSYIIPELSTVAQPIREMGELAARQILRSISDRDARPETFILNTSLIERQSVARPPADRA